jgi:hypothetical protein
MEDPTAGDLVIGEAIFDGRREPCEEFVNRDSVPDKVRKV